MMRGSSAQGHGGAGEPERGANAGASQFPAAPRLLSHRAEPPPLPPPLREADEIASLHVKFARLVSGAAGEASPAASPSRGVPGEDARGEGGRVRGGGGWSGGTGGGVRAKVRARVAAVARADASADRELMGSLVRAVAALAERVDEITQRLGHLELLVEDVVDRVSEDLARVQASLGSLGPSDTPGTLEPGTLEPGTLEPGTLEPGTLEPGTLEPGTLEPGTLEPGTLEPGTLEPGTLEQPQPGPHEQPQPSPHEQPQPSPHEQPQPSPHEQPQPGVSP
jgi:hypothetical protein